VVPTGEISKRAPVIVQVSRDLTEILNILSNWGELGRSTEELPVALEVQRLLANIRSVTGTSNRCTQADCSGCTSFQGTFRCHPEVITLPGQQTEKPQGECDVWALMHTAKMISAAAERTQKRPPNTNAKKTREDFAIAFKL
jgi:hypothetical protein